MDSWRANFSERWLEKLPRVSLCWKEVSLSIPAAAMNYQNMPMAKPPRDYIYPVFAYCLTIKLEIDFFSCYDDFTGLIKN